MVSRQVHEGDVQTSGYRQNDFFPEEAFAGRLTTDFGVAAIPPSVFYQNNQDKEDHRVLRFCFAKTTRTLDTAAERHCSIRCH
jgi:aspartate/methionine/tyrosine aminotransferase